MKKNNMENQMENKNPELNLNLTLNEVNLLLKAMGTQPLAEVLDLFTKIRNQATQQLQPQQPPPPSPEAE